MTVSRSTDEVCDLFSRHCPDFCNWVDMLKEPCQCAAADPFHCRQSEEVANKIARGWWGWAGVEPEQVKLSARRRLCAVGRNDGGSS